MHNGSPSKSPSTHATISARMVSSVSCLAWQPGTDRHFIKHHGSVGTVS